jgi:hypothetical protein
MHLGAKKRHVLNLLHICPWSLLVFRMVNTILVKTMIISCSIIRLIYLYLLAPVQPTRSPGIIAFVPHHKAKTTSPPLDSKALTDASKKLTQRCRFRLRTSKDPKPLTYIDATSSWWPRNRYANLSGRLPTVWAPTNRKTLTRNTPDCTARSAWPCVTTITPMVVPIPSSVLCVLHIGRSARLLKNEAYHDTAAEACGSHSSAVDEGFPASGI